MRGLLRIRNVQVFVEIWGIELSFFSLPTSLRSWCQDICPALIDCCPCLLHCDRTVQHWTGLVFNWYYSYTQPSSTLDHILSSTYRLIYNSSLVYNTKDGWSFLPQPAFSDVGRFNARVMLTTTFDIGWLTYRRTSFWIQGGLLPICKWFLVDSHHFLTKFQDKDGDG